MSNKLTEQQKIGAKFTALDMHALAFFHRVLLNFIKMDKIFEKNLK